ncbi:MAG: hypothetical protein KF830_12320 [Planctomycetes bacterium]|nr:hypothetical protein [Planctomycetota bacterium]
MSEKSKSKPGAVGRSFKLFATIFVVLLVPLGMDQAGVTRETVQMAGRIAGGITLLLLLYGIFSKLFRVFAFVVLALIAMVVLVSEGKIQAPRLSALFGSSDAR